MRNKLPLHEWGIILLFCIILMVLSGIAIGRQSLRQHTPFSPTEAPMDSLVHVSVKGAVTIAGKYDLAIGSTIQDLLNLSGLSPAADLSQIKLKTKLKNGQRILVPERKWMTIYLEGAVENPGAMKIMSGIRCQELSSVLTLPPEADVKALQKRRHYLREGEVVHIPFKQSKEKKTKVPAKIIDN
jgi:protein involved in polysaccharide export with SLBB domain